MLKKLRKERAELTAKMSSIAGTKRDAGQGMTDEEKRSFDDASARVKEIDAEVSRIEEARSLSVQDAVVTNDNQDTEEFRSFLRGEELRSQSTLTPGAGGYTVGANVQNRVIEAVKSASGIISNASSINTANGTEISYPTLDDTANEAVITAETDARRLGPDVVFGSIALKSFTYDSGIIKISNELVQDSAVDIEQVVINNLSKRISRKLNKDFTTGAGVTEPAGIVNQATLGITTVAIGAITSDELLDLQFTVDEAYLPKAKYMMNSATLKAIAKLKDGQGNYLLGSAVDGMSKTLFGKPIVVNNDMPDIATGATPIVFGDLSAYMVRTVQGLSIFKFNEKYQDTNEIGYKASGRFDGVLLDNAAVKTLKMA